MIHGLSLALALAPSWLFGPPVQRPRTLDPVTLDWQAPASCPSEAEVLARLPPTRSRLSVHAKIVAVAVADAAGFSVELRLTNAEGQSSRAFAARDCATLTDAIVLVVAVTVDPVGVVEQLAAERASEVAEPAPAPEPAPTPAPSPTAERAPEFVDTRPRAMPDPIAAPLAAGRERVRVGLRALAGVGYGPTRGGARANVGGSLALIGDRWRWELGGSWSTPRVVRPSPLIGGRVQGWSIATRACFVPIVARVIELPLCLGIEAGQVRGRGLDSLPRVQSSSLVWVAPNLAQGLWWAPLRRLAIGVEVGLQVPLTRGSFVVGEVEVDRISSIGVRGLAGFEVRLP